MPIDHSIKAETIKINKGMPIFIEGETVEDIALIVSGKVDIIHTSEYKESNEKIYYRIGVLAEGFMIGVSDLLSAGIYLDRYVAASDCIILLLNINNAVDLDRYFSEERDYYTYSIGTNARLIKYIRYINETIHSYVKELRYMEDYLALNIVLSQDIYKFERKISASVLAKGKKLLARMKELGETGSQLVDYSYFISVYTASDEETPVKHQAYDSKEIEYFTALADVKPKSCKDFFAESAFISYVHLENSTITFNFLKDELKQLMSQLLPVIAKVNSDDRDNAYSEYIQSVVSLESRGEIPTALIDVVTNAKDIIDEIKFYMSANLNLDITLGNNVYHTLYNRLFVTEIERIALTYENASKTQVEEIIDYLRDSASKILDYSEIDVKFRDKFLSALESFVKTRDKFSFDPEINSVRKEINLIFYKLYEKVYLKSKQDPEPLDRVIEMFLDFAYVDERLLDMEQLIYLYKLDSKVFQDDSKQIFSMRSWLDKILEGQRMPSINEFDLDYADNLRELRKQRQYTEQEQKQYLNDMVGRVEYEIKNMLKSTMKMCNGQFLTYVPILFTDSIYGDIEKNTNTAVNIENILQDIVNIDYSIFYREVLYYRENSEFDREYVMKEVRPDIIIVPTAGTRVIPWQDIASRNRSLPGRIVVPMFMNGNFYDMLLFALGQYRWDLCRSVMGTAWSNIQVKSLTSEYCDYLQFYKKNQILSEAVKEKIKQQIASNRNQNRDIFAEDYVTWLKYEVTGAIRLNKVVREIMVRYCTPSKGFLGKLVEQNLFRDIILKNNIKKFKKVRELEGKYDKVKKANHNILPTELDENLRFYRDL